MIESEIGIIGGGIIGLSCAYALSEKQSDKSIVVIEKEKKICSHQSGRNSGVIHSGIYYKPGSLKAKNCRAGKVLLEEFCKREQIPFEICGKIVVATDESELAGLEKVYRNGTGNSVNCRLIGPEKIKQLEPHVNGIRALYVPEAGIVDYQAVCDRIAEKLTAKGHRILTGNKIKTIARHGERLLLFSGKEEIRVNFLVNCAGLYSDTIARISGSGPEVKIIPFRGEYYKLKEEASNLCNNLICLVPGLEFPFLGVHFTRMIEGGVECGPNAVLAFAKEGYRKFDINIKELFESITYPGFLHVARKYWMQGLNEFMRSISKRLFIKSLQRLIPEIDGENLIAAPSGIRAQAVGRNGELIDDFLFMEDERIIHVLNAPSPAATSAFNIGKTIAAKLSEIGKSIEVS
jgi:(S)-2-hydroxyglutarate dehydrogenase